MKDLFAPPVPISILAVDIAVPLPVPGVFTYSVPEHLTDKIKTGVRARLPFKNRELIGYVVGQKPVLSDVPLKPILDILDIEPVLSSEILALTQWLSEYYACSWGEAIENALPKWVKYGKKAEKALKKDEAVKQPAPKPKAGFALSPGQTVALESIREALNNDQPKPILLFGVTGSGKSEVYIRAIHDVLKRNQSAICLVPEIALTEQLRHFFLDHFGHELEILHSKLSDNERFLAWKRLQKGERRVILGPRSAVFAPVPNLGLIIMDEEHENSYKQETVPRYHARKVAAWRAKNENALFVMGTATPSLETMYACQKGEITRIDLAQRIDNKPMPGVQLIDLKDAGGGSKKPVILTVPMAKQIEENLKKKEGTLLLLNRRGFSTYIHCPKCGTVESCSSCQVSLTFHQEDGTLLCHYCNLTRPVPNLCSNCKSPLMRFDGFGTEKLESEVALRFPNARISRMDTDSVRKKGSHEKILKEFRERRIDIMIGTQMIAKGFDFPHVTLVGVILADVGLMLPDFRSGERTFQLLTQVAGRAGRGKQPGRVLVQTYSPDHPSIRFARHHDFPSFYQHEIKDRFEHHYPPFYRLMNWIVRSKDEKKAYQFSKTLRETLETKFHSERENVGSSIEIIGPAPLPFYKLRGHYRWHVMLKIARDLEILPGIRELVLAMKKPTGVAYALDVDPLSIL